MLPPRLGQYGQPMRMLNLDHIAGLICDAAREHRSRLDGVLVSLHGSMVPTFCEDGEGELLRRLRAIVGPDLPIAASLDLHAMVTPAMVEQAQILVSYKSYPHIDMPGHRATCGPAA